jgi:hypothetical protein
VQRYELHDQGGSLLRVTDEIKLLETPDNIYIEYKFPKQKSTAS